MKTNKLIAAVVIGVQFPFAAFAQGTNSTGAEIDALKNEVQALEQKVDALEQQQAAQSNPAPQTAQVQELDQKVRVLERQRELDQETAAEAAKTQPKITLDANGFSFSSANSNFVGTLHGLLQTDSRTFFADTGGTLGKNQFLIRRARPIFTGTVFHDFDFNFTPDFGGNSATATPVIYDAYLNYHYNPAFQIEGGRFKSPVGLEALQSDGYMVLNERSLASDLVPNRDIGFMLHGDLFSGRASYAAGILDGAPDYTTPTPAPLATDDDKAFAGRLFLQPFKTSDEDYLQGLGFGVGGSYEDDRGTAATSDLTGGYKTDGQQTFFSYAAGVFANGVHWRLSPQGYYYYGPLSVMGEYAVSDQEVSSAARSADVRNTAWEGNVGWVLTGENATYNGVTPLHPFNLHDGGWGAWQIVARYSALYVDEDAFSTPTFATAGSANAARAWAVGLNWYLNRDIRVNTSFSRTTFGGGHGPTGANSPITAQPENVLFTRVQLAF
jgi:phosphate-selective porin OprO and OprP